MTTSLEEFDLPETTASMWRVEQDKGFAACNVMHNGRKVFMQVTRTDKGYRLTCDDRDSRMVELDLGMEQGDDGNLDNLVLAVVRAAAILHGDSREHDYIVKVPVTVEFITTCRGYSAQEAESSVRYLHLQRELKMPVTFQSSSGYHHVHSEVQGDSINAHKAKIDEEMT